MQGLRPHSQLESPPSAQHAPSFIAPSPCAGVAIEGGESLAADLVIDTSGRRSKVCWGAQQRHEGRTARGPHGTGQGCRDLML